MSTGINQELAPNLRQNPNRSLCLQLLGHSPLCCGAAYVIKHVARHPGNKKALETTQESVGIQLPTANPTGGSATLWERMLTITVDT